MHGNMTRRSAVGLLGAGGVVGAVLGNARSRLGGPPTPHDAKPALRAGTAFGRWVIAAVHPVALGALRVDVAARGGEVFPLEIVARDPHAAPVVAVGELAIHVCNGGDGAAPTLEEQGLAAMALGELLELHGQAAHIDGLMTHAARTLAYGDELMSPMRRPG